MTDLISMVIYITVEQSIWYTEDFSRFPHLQRMERSVIFIVGTPQLWETESKKKKLLKITYSIICGVLMILRKVRDQPIITREDLVNDLKRAGTTVSTVTISVTLHRHGLKSCSTRKVPLLKPAHVPSEVYQRPSGWSRGGMGEGHVVRWDQNITFFGINSPCGVVGRMRTFPRTPSQPWSMGVETSCFGGALLQRGQDDCTVLRGGWMGHVSWDFGQQPPSLSKSIEDGSWLDLPAWQCWVA